MLSTESASFDFSFPSAADSRLEDLPLSLPGPYESGGVPRGEARPSLLFLAALVGRMYPAGDEASCLFPRPVQFGRGLGTEVHATQVRAMVG